jgi:sugar lactone lactonase YvrE
MNRSPFANEVAPTPADIICVADVGLNVGESPIWSAAEGCVYFVDIVERKLLRFTPSDGTTQVVALDAMAAAVAPRSTGGLLVAGERDFATFDARTGSRTAIAVVDEPAGNRFNDGKCDRRGRFWAGTMDKVQWDAPSGTLYRLDANGAVTVTLRGIRCSNGLGWSPDNRTFYYTESFAYVIHAFDHDPETGVLSNRRRFAALDPAFGAFPDGLTVDAEGGVWSAQPVYGRLVRYAPDGSIERIVDMPVSRPTSCIFGGDDLGTLFVTSAHNSLTAQQRAEEPLAGGLFAIRPGVVGLPEVPFAG